MPRPRRQEYLRPGVEALEDRQLLAALVVTNALDSGPGSLRQAILDANAAQEPSSIGFDIAGAGVHTIPLTSGLPLISVPLTLDATTQPGYAGTPLVAIDGTNAGLISGLVLSPSAAGSSVAGLAIERFAEDGINAYGVTGLVIRNNFIGVDPTGASGAGNGSAGVDLADGSDDIVGGDGTASNVIGTNGSWGVILALTTNDQVVHNFIGTDATGQPNLGNARDGVFVGFGSTGAFVGSNVIVHNGRLAVEDQGMGTVLDGNVDSDNGGQVANVVVVASTTSLAATTGQLLTFTYTLTNQGPHEADHVILGLYSEVFYQSFDLFVPPAVFQLVTASTTQGSITPDAGLNDFASLQFAQIGTLAPGTSATVTVTVRVAHAGVDSLHATTSSDQPQTDPATSTDTTVTATSAADLAVTEVQPPTVAKIGVPQTLTFLVTNRSSVDSVLPTIGVAISGPGASILAVSASQGTISPAPGRPDLYFGTLTEPTPTSIFSNDLVGLAPGASATITVVILPAHSGRFAVAVQATAPDNLDPDSRNDVATLNARSTLAPAITTATLLPTAGPIRAVTLAFDAPLQKSKATITRNYRVGTRGVAVGIRSATYDASTGLVTLRLAHPLARKGPAIQVRVAGHRLTAPDGSSLLGGAFAASLSRN